MEFAKGEDENKKLFFSKIEEFQKSTKIDVELLEQYVQHMNRIYDRDPDGFLMDNGSYLQLGLIVIPVGIFNNNKLSVSELYGNVAALKLLNLSVVSH